MVPLNEKILPSEPYSIEIRLKCATSLPGYETNYFRNHFHVEVFKNQIFIGKTCSSKPKWNTLFTIPIHTLDDHIRFSFCFWMKKIFQLPSTEHSSLVNKHSAKSMESSTSTTIVTHGSAQPLRISRKDNKFSASFAIYPFRREPTTEGNHALTPSAYQLLGTADIEISEIIFKGFDKLPEFTLPLHLPDSSNSNHCVTSGSITLNCKIERNQDEI